MNERELIIDPSSLQVLDSSTGTKIYDSDDTIGTPVVDFDVDDWDGDGIDDILARFGPDARFHTCSAADMTVDQLIDFLAQRGKFIEDGDGFSTAADRICGH